MSKRISLFVIVNFLIIFSVSLIFNFLQAHHIFPSLKNIKVSHLAILCLVWGFSGSFLSLLFSRIIAKKSMGIQIIDPNTYDPDLKALLETVYEIAEKAKIKKMPQVGIYPSDEINAFATGPSKNKALVAISSGLLHQMPIKGIYGVLGHEMAHVANGDMVTMTLIQGIVNSFVLFLPRLIASVLMDDNRSGFRFLIRYFITIGLEIIFGILGSIVVCYFSRRREFRADAAGAALCGKDNMVAALESLLGQAMVPHVTAEPTGLAALKISGVNKGLLASLFATHPPIKTRIRRLRAST
jgi:heat shock protein HtpX